MYSYIAIFVGGGLGSIARFSLSRYIHTLTSSAFPLGTLVVNIISCLILGSFLGFSNEKMLASSNVKLLIIAGFCGGFSTFSTFSYETVELIRSGNMMYAIANILVSVVLCVGVILFLLKNLN